MAELKAQSQQSTQRQAAKFGLVGILNTTIDFIIFQLLTKIFAIPLDSVFISVAKQVSGTAAMANSFFLNRFFVFRKGESKHGGQQALKFIATTAVGVYIIQAGLIYVFTSIFPQFGMLAFQVADVLGIVDLLPIVFTEAFIIKTVAFGFATLGSMTWNFTLYKVWAFKE